MVLKRLRHYYDTSPYWGAWPTPDSEVITSRLGRISQGEVMQLQVRVRQGIVVDVRIQAYGSGYTLAVLAYAAERLHHQPIHALPDLSVPMVAKALQLPEHKLHSAVLLERLVGEVLIKLEGGAFLTCPPEGEISKARSDVEGEG